MLSETVQHYNADVDFFKQFLDPYMKYTSGLFKSVDEGLDTATQRMLDVIIDVGNIRPGGRILEVGPGWGALLKRMHERGIICDYLGLSPSDVQNTYIRGFASAKESVLTTTFELFDAGVEKFDAIVLIGSFCHLKDKSTQLAKMKSMLAEHGQIVIEDTFFMTRDVCRQHVDNDATRFLQKEIFGFAEILALSDQIEQIAEVGLRLCYLYEHSSSYRQTIERWIKKLKKMEVEKYPRSREFIKYMMIAQKGWGVTTQNHLMVLRDGGKQTAFY